VNRAPDRGQQPSAGRAPAIELFAVAVRYGDRNAVDGVSLRVEPGECLMLVGGSGSGKTTTLKVVNRLIEPSAGRVEIDGADVRGVPGPELRRRIGYGFQQVGLFPHLTVAENVGVTPELLGWDAARVRARTDELLALLELPPGEFRARFPHELSGGQAQRVGLARALAGGARLLLLDEPFGALDPATRDRLQESFARIRRELAPTVVFVTHDMAEALLLADRIAVLRDGQLVQLAPPAEILARPADSGVRELFEGPRRQARALLSLAGEATP
jgi:osmoprotectant transport system ATP-binding protein